MRIKHLIVSTALALLALVCTSAWAKEPLTCALLPDKALGFANSAVFSLLEVEVSRDPALALLQRAEIDKILQEQTLQLALAAGGVGARRGLGTLLKARMLVVLRAEEKQVERKLTDHTSRSTAAVSPESCDSAAAATSSSHSTLPL